MNTLLIASLALSVARAAPMELDEEGKVVVNIGTVLDRVSSAGAVAMAIEEATKRGLLANISLRLFLHPNAQPFSKAINQAIGMCTQNNVNAVIGGLHYTVCSTMGPYLTKWNLPFFPEGCPGEEVANKTKYRTTIRVEPPIDKFGIAMVELFRFYGWDRAVLLTHQATCLTGMETVRSAFGQNGVTVAEYISFKEKDSSSVSDQLIEIYLQSLRDRAKVMVMCAFPWSILKLMLRAQELGMTNGDYAFVYMWYSPDVVFMEPWRLWPMQHNATLLRQFKTALMSMKTLSRGYMYGERADRFFHEVMATNRRLPIGNVERPKVTAINAYHAAFVYITLVNKTLSQGEDFRNGTALFQRVVGREFHGFWQDIHFDENGDSRPVYWVFDVMPDWQRAGHYLEIRVNESKGVTRIRETFWAPNQTEAPGFDKRCGLELCKPPDKRNSTTVLSVCVATTSLLILIVICFLRRKHRLDLFDEKKWRIPNNELIALDSTLRTYTFNETPNSSTLPYTPLSQNGFLRYKSHVVTLREVPYIPKEVSSDFLKKINEMLRLSHENINSFIGVCVEHEKSFSLMTYKAKGTLREIIANRAVNLDATFKNSLISDLIEGMYYLHRSALCYHGHLSSHVCLIDPRWTLRITGYDIDILGTKNTLTSQLWTAPEVLRDMDMRSIDSHRRADVYSFGIIVQEIVFMVEPFFVEDINAASDIVRRVLAISTNPFRPAIDSMATNLNPELRRLMLSSWEEDPHQRPLFARAKKTMATINCGRKVNLLDNAVAKMEKYALDLESLVEQRTQELFTEKMKTEELLDAMLPKSVAHDLIRGNAVMAEFFDSVTILFLDFVGFTGLCSTLSAIEIIDVLNDLYVTCDGILTTHEVYKVETISDQYMVVCGLPIRNRQHTKIIARTALDLLHRGSNRHPALKIRMGMHTGACAAGVIGQKMPRYCLFGDTVNVASRMQSNSIEGMIHVSTEVKAALSGDADFVVTTRGVVQLKGKGAITTFWLTSGV